MRNVIINHHGNVEEVSAPAFTPGPWEAADRGDYSDYDGNSRVILGDDMRIAVVQHHGTKRDEANARLIAAAPDMYEALRQLVSDAEVAKAHLPPDASIVSSSLFDTISQAQAALAKARGEQ